MKKFLISIFIFFSFIVSSSAEVNPSLVNVEWQKKYLEDAMLKKVKSKLNTVIENEKYTVDIEIITTTPRKPNFKQSPKQMPEEVKFTNAKSSSPGDYIVFSKFGLESPITANMSAKDTPKNSEYEYLWKFQQSQSIFNNLETIVLSVGLPDVLSNEQRTMIENLVKTTKFNLKDFSVDYEFKYLDLKTLELFETKDKNTSETANEPKAIDEQTMDLISKLASPIGILLAALIISICSLVIFKKYAKLRGELLNNKVQLDSNAQVEGNNDSEEKENGEFGVATGESSDPLNEESISGVERFIKTFDENPETIFLLVKNWIKGKEIEGAHSLVYLLDKLETEYLRRLFNELDQSERQEWKNIVEETPFSKIDVKVTDQYITKAIVNSYMVPDEVEDTELKSKLLSISPDNAAQFVKENSDLAPLFLSVSPTHLINKVLAAYDLQQRQELLSNAAKIEVKKAKDLLSTLNERITPFARTVSVSPFIEKIIGMIPSANYEDESSLYNILFESNIYEKVKQLAIDNFPSFLVDHLSEDSLNKVFMSFPMSKRAEVIESFQNEEIKRNYISTFAKEGSTALEMYNLEIERFVIDEDAVRSLDEKRNENIEFFYNRTKEIIKKDVKVQSDVKNVVENWVNSRREGSDDLKLVS